MPDERKCRYCGYTLKQADVICSDWDFCIIRCAQQLKDAQIEAGIARSRLSAVGILVGGDKDYRERIANIRAVLYAEDPGKQEVIKVEGLQAEIAALREGLRRISDTCSRIDNEESSFLELDDIVTSVEREAAALLKPGKGE